MTVEGPLAPIVVTLTAEVVNQTLSLRAFGERRGVTDRGFVDRRNVRVTGIVNVSGGNATLTAAVTLTHAVGGANPPSPIVSSIFTSRQIMPNLGGVSYTTDIPFSVPLGATSSGMVTVEVTGTDARGGQVNLSLEQPFSQELSQRPAGACVDTDTVLCAGDQRFEIAAFWRDGDNNRGQAVVTAGQRFPDKAWFSFPGASMSMPDPNGLDLLVELVDACTDTGNAFWIFAVSSTALEITLVVRDTQIGDTHEYFNPLGTRFDLLRDLAAFAVCP
jgi:hypothetical protein